MDQDQYEDSATPLPPRQKTQRGSRGGKKNKKTRRGSRGGTNRNLSKPENLTHPVVGEISTQLSEKSFSYERDTPHYTIRNWWTSKPGTWRRSRVAVLVMAVTCAISIAIRNKGPLIELEIFDLNWKFEKQNALIFWSLLVVPIATTGLSWLGNDRFYSEETQRSPAFSYLLTTETILTILGTVLSFLFSYIIIALVAWDNITDVPSRNTPNHWYWTDRQTIAFAITLVVSILAAMLTNASKDLSAANQRLRDEYENVSNRSRFLLNAIQQETEFLWDEFETVFKSKGKWFLYTSNSFIKQKGATAAQEILSYLDSTFVDGLANEVFESHISARLRDLNNEQRLGLDWSENIWSKVFNQRDFLDLLPQKPLNLDELLNPSRVELTQQDLLAIEIASRIRVSSSDGRLCLIDTLDEQTKSYGLACQRRANSLCVKIEVKGGGKKWVYGYFPTDSSLTLEIVNRMMTKSGDEKSDYKTWFQETYVALQTFSSKNQKRINHLNKLLGSLEDLLSRYALPISLLTDDSRLLMALLDIGSDNPYAGSSLEEQQCRTLARFLTYASAYYSGQVWNQDHDRALPGNFPSPFLGMQKKGTKHRRHTARRFEEFRKSLEISLSSTLNYSPQGKSLSDKGLAAAQWATALEVLNPQSPTLNWIRAGYAYVTREAFLSADIDNSLADDSEDLVIELGVRQRLIETLFRSNAPDNSPQNYLESLRISSLSLRFDGSPEALVGIIRRSEDVALMRSEEIDGLSLSKQMLTEDTLMVDVATSIAGPMPLKIGAKSQILPIVPRVPLSTSTKRES